MKLPFSTEDHLIISLFIHIILFPHLVFLDLDTFFLYSLFIYFPRKEQRPGKQYNIKRKCNTYLNGCYWRYTPYCFSNIGWFRKSIHTRACGWLFLYSKNLVVVFYFLYAAILHFKFFIFYVWILETTIVPNIKLMSLLDNSWNLEKRSTLKNNQLS